MKVELDITVFKQQKKVKFVTISITNLLNPKMTYSSSEIKQVQELAQNADLKNSLLAFELIKGRGMLPEFITALYWIYNRFIWAEDKASEQEVAIFLIDFLSIRHKVEKIYPLLAEQAISLKKTLHPKVEEQAHLIGLDLQLLAILYFDYWGLSNHPINQFLFRYGTLEIQQKILPLFKTKEYTGRSLLDLGGLKLKKLPSLILQEKNIQGLKIWGNELEELPDFWEAFQLLEMLNIADNKLNTFPKSFLKLNKLQKLYAQNNQFEAQKTIATIKQLPQLHYLAIASPSLNTGFYTFSENQLLQHFEELVNHNKINASAKEQNLILGLYLNDETALKNLSLIHFFDALLDKNEETRNRARAKILNWEGSVFDGILPDKASIAILGMVSFATRSKINQPQKRNIRFTAEISKETTHILLGDFPEKYEAVQERQLVFLTEKDLEQFW